MATTLPIKTAPALENARDCEESMQEHALICPAFIRENTPTVAEMTANAIADLQLSKRSRVS